jgi:hypothetical protein
VPEETPEAVVKAAQEKAAKLREQLLVMHEADVAELEKLPISKREHGSRLYKAFRRQREIDSMIGAAKPPPAPEQEDRSEGLLERLAREEDEAAEVVPAESTQTAKGNGTASAVHKPANAANPVRARVIKPLNETLRELVRISARRDWDALAELEAAELAGEKRADVLETIAKVRSEHERRRALASAVPV